MKPPLLTSFRIVSIFDKWRMDAHAADLDRAELMRHFNGGALEDDDDESGRNSPRRANMLFGHRLLKTPATRLFSTYNQGVGLLDGALKKTAKMAGSRRNFVETTVNRLVNALIRKFGRLYWPYRAASGDAVIWGGSFLFRDDRYDWAPKYGRAYHEWNAPPDVTNDKFSQWGFAGELTCGEILARLERLKEVDPEDSYWDKKQLQDVAEKLIKRHSPENAWAWPANGTVDDDPIAVRERIQAQAWGSDAIASTLPVYWFYSKRFDDGNERPVDLYCVPRYGESCSDATLRNGAPKLTIKRDNKELGDVLFYHPKAFDNVNECLFPFIVSTQLGGEPMLRRVMGLGTLNYDLDIKIQNNVHLGMEAAEFAGMPLFQESDTASATQLQDLSAASIRPFDVMPAGIQFLPKEKNAFPYKSTLDYVGLLSGKMEDNSTASFGVGDSGKRGKEELEVAVLQRQQENAAIVSDSMGDWQRAGDPMCAAIGNAILCADLLECDASFPIQSELKEALEQEGIQWSEVEDQFTWSMRRAPGHGDQGLALARAQQTAQVAARLGPEAQKIATRNLIAAINGDDVALAMEMVPDGPPTSEQDQVNAAMGQNAVAMATGVPPIGRETDMVQIHVPIHLGALGRMAQNAMTAGDQWTPQSQQSFEAVAAHAMKDIQHFGQIDERAAKQAQQQLMQLVGKASNFKVGTDVQSPVDPVAAEKLRQGAAKLAQAQQFKQLDMAKWERTQGHREQAGRFNEDMQMGYLHETEQNNAVKRATQIVKSVKDAQQPASVPDGDADD